GGAILNVGSLAGESPGRSCSAYAASKSALRFVTMALRSELKARGVRVALLAPGMVATDLTTKTEVGEDAAPGVPLRDLLATSPRAVAEAGYLGLNAGPAVIVPGLLAFPTYYAFRALPGALTSALHNALPSLSVETTPSGDQPTAPPSSFGARALAAASRLPGWQALGYVRPALRARPLLVGMLVFALIALVSGMTTWRSDQPTFERLSKGDARIAVSIQSDGAQTWRGNAREVLEAGPTAPVILAVAALFSSGFETTLKCAADRAACSSREQHATNGLVLLQWTAAMAMLAATYLMAWRLSASHPVALLTMVFMYLGIRVAEFSALSLPVIWFAVLPLFALAAALEALCQRRIIFGFVAGGFAGLAAGLMPAFAVLIPTLPIVLIAAAALDRGLRRGRRVVWLGLATLVGGLGSLSAVLFATPAGDLSDRWAMFAATQLAEHDGLRAVPTAALPPGYILPIPLVGDAAEPFVGEATVNTFAVYAPGAFASAGRAGVLNDMHATSQSGAESFAWIAKKAIISDPLTWLSTLPLLTVRGLFGGGGLIALIGLLMFWRSSAYQITGTRAASLIVVVVPLAALLVAGAALTPNHYYFQQALVFIYAYSVANVVRSL
ncbi:MAG: SDR family NAD(P)-dependent oxidoreductase, partial [Pseudomonadota bacterium]